MGELLAKNLQFIQKHPDIVNISVEQIKKKCTDKQHYQQEKHSWLLSRSNEKTLKINQTFIHSNRSPKQETKRISHFLIEQKKKHIILSGIGMGYLLSPHLLENLSSVCVIEFDPFLLYTLLFHIDLQVINTFIPFNILFIENIKETQLEELLPFFQNKQAEELCFYQNPTLLEVYPEQSQTLQIKLQELLHKRLVNQATLIKFQDLWNKNYYLNLLSIIQSISIKQFIRDLKIHALHTVLVSAGPSLSKELDILYKYQSSLLIVSVDTAYIPLKKYKIQPDIVFCTDPQWLNHFYVHYKDVEKAIWILDPIANHNIIHYLEKKEANIIFWNSTFLPDQIIQQIYGNRGDIRHGGSVSTNAFDFCVQVTQRSLILLGQDLSYNKQMTHVRGAYLEEQEFLLGDRLRSIETFSYQYLSALPPIKVSGIKKNTTVRTDARMHIFLEWFQKSTLLYNNAFPNLKLYNATGQGANITGILNISLKEVLQSLKTPKQQKHLFIDILQKKKENEQRHKALLSYLKNLIQDIEEIHEAYQNNINLISKSNDTIHSYTSKNTLFHKLDKNDYSIRTKKLANDIIGIGAQSTIIKLTEQQENNDPIKNALFLYKSMSLSCKNTLIILKKVIYRLKVELL